MRALVGLAIALFGGPILAQETRLPIIDMHFHAVAVDSQGPPPVPTCAPIADFPAADPARPFAVQWLEMMNDPPCTDAVWSPETDEDLMSASLAVLEQHNIIGVTSGPAELVRAFEDAVPERIVQGLIIGGPLAGSDASIQRLRNLHSQGRLEVIGELTTQYAGIAPDDERLDALWALADELDLPVGIHIGPGPPGAPYLGTPGYRARLHSALTLEEVLIRHPTLRVYIMHAGWPMIDDLLTVLYTHPQVYVELAIIDWAVPTPEFHRYLRRIVEAGFGKRVMYGSDQMVWPDVVERSIGRIESAAFLSQEQRRDIFYNNAARFLRLTPEQIARHHAM